MKYLVLLALVLGFAHGNTEEVASLQEILPMADVFSSLDQLLPAGFIGKAKGIMSTFQNNEGPVATMRAVDKVIKIKTIVDTFVAPIAQIAMELIQFANEILALVGLVLLIIYCIDGGDVKALLGTGRSLATWSSFDVNVLNNPLLDTLSELVFEAFDKYAESD